jgi:hypothetical protein
MSKDRRDIIGYKYKDDEQELREKIAQDILEWAQKYHDNPIVENCVRIARGK